jgi:hypothetical protein
MVPTADILLIFVIEGIIPLAESLLLLVKDPHVQFM